MHEIEGCVCPPPQGTISIVVARFNKTITKRLLDGALAKLREHKVPENDIQVVWVPGAFEIPFVANYLARDSKCLAVICLGAVIKGDTTHDQHINRAVSMAISEAANDNGVPVIFGVLTCDTIEQAEARSGIIESKKDKVINPAPGNKGAEAAEAALEMIDLMTELPDIKSNPLKGLQLPDFETFARIIGAPLNLDEDEDDDDEDEDDYDDYDDDDYDDDDDDYDDEEEIVLPPKRGKKK